MNLLDVCIRTVTTVKGTLRNNKKMIKYDSDGLPQTVCQTAAEAYLTRSARTLCGSKQT